MAARLFGDAERAHHVQVVPQRVDGGMLGRRVVADVPPATKGSPGVTAAVNASSL